jgi:Ca2+-binding EF-hand superfamily protein
MRRIVLASLLVLAAGPVRAQPVAMPATAPQLERDSVTAVVRMDSNHDGAISRQEWLANGALDADFTAVDADKDGRVTVAELRAYRTAHAKTDDDRAALKAENPKFDPEITIRMADTNRDGGVSEAEWVAYGGHGGPGFTPIDANHDGKITVEELTAYRNAHKPR